MIIVTIIGICGDKGGECAFVGNQGQLAQEDMNIISSSFIYLLIFAFGSLKASDANGYDDYCSTVYTTTTIFGPPQSSTFTYTSTVIVPAGTAEVVTKTVNKPESLVLETSLMDYTRTLVVVSKTTSYKGATTTSTTTKTVTIFPNAVTSVTSVEKLVIYVKGTLTVTFPAPVITIASISRYTGAPTSLWLSVI